MTATWSPVTTPLYSFTEDSVLLHGRIDLPLTVGEFPKTSTIVAEFLIVDYPSAFNTLLGRPNLKALKAVTSIYHLAMKFPTTKGIGILKGSQKDAWECYNAAIKIADKKKWLVQQTMVVVDFDNPLDFSLDPREPLDELKLGPVEELIDLVVDP